MTLKGKTPDLVVASKPKFLISGASGVGKTFFSLDFPKPYLIDCEGGATRRQYQDKLKKVGGIYLGKEEGSQDFNIVIEEIKKLFTEKHPYKTLIIDSFSYIYLLEAAKAAEEIGDDFGKDKKEANKPTRQLMRVLEKLDMTVILICHSKEKWLRRGKEIISAGTTFDGYDKLEYMLDLWLEMVNVEGLRRMIVKKSRIDSFSQGIDLPLDYVKFSELYGKEVIEKESTPVTLATQTQVERIKELLEIVKITDEEIEKWFKKFDVDEWSEMTGEQIDRCILFIEKRMKGDKK